MFSNDEDDGLFKQPVLATVAKKNEGPVVANGLFGGNDLKEDA